MYIAILSRNPKLYFTYALVQDNLVLDERPMVY